MIFVARQLQEKCREQHQNLYLAFVDLTKAFDTVNQDLLMKILRKFGCPPTFIAIQQFHTGMCALTYLGSNLSFSGELTNEIQRCINLASSAFGRPSKRVW